MSVRVLGSCLPPSSSLPPIRSLPSASEGHVTAGLKNLRALYCPVRLPTVITTPVSKRDRISIVSPPTPVDSGYASQEEDEDDDELAFEEVTAALRADPYERTFATRWLNSLLAQSEEMNLDDEAREKIVDDAGFILSSLFELPNNVEEEALTRDFTFLMASGDEIQVTLNDAPLSDTDHTAVGLQSWGASIMLSSMMCADPARFGLDPASLGATPNIIELGAGTGLVSLALAKVLPEIGILGSTLTATDYHPAVLENCDVNIETNFPSQSYDTPPVATAVLDWAQPPPDQKAMSHLLIASDVVYAPEHAAWLRDCAAHLLAAHGTFWLMVTVRKTGKFEGIPDTVEFAFLPESCPRSENGTIFQILEKEFVEKKRGIGRGDENGYNLYRIGWK